MQRLPDDAEEDRIWLAELGEVHQVDFFVVEEWARKRGHVADEGSLNKSFVHPACSPGLDRKMPYLLRVGPLPAGVARSQVGPDQDEVLVSGVVEQAQEEQRRRLGHRNKEQNVAVHASLEGLVLLSPGQYVLQSCLQRGGVTVPTEELFQVDPAVVGLTGAVLWRNTLMMLTRVRLRADLGDVLALAQEAVRESYGPERQDERYLARLAARTVEGLAGVAQDDPEKRDRPGQGVGLDPGVIDRAVRLLHVPWSERK